MSLNNSATTPNITAAAQAVANLSGALHGLHTYLGQEAAINAYFFYYEYTRTHHEVY